MSLRPEFKASEIKAIDERIDLLRKFGDTHVRPDLTVSDVALIARALRLATGHPSVGDSDIVSNRLIGIVNRLRAEVEAIDPSLGTLFESAVEELITEDQRRRNGHERNE